MCSLCLKIKPNPVRGEGCQNTWLSHTLQSVPVQPEIRSEIATFGRVIFGYTWSKIDHCAGPVLKSGNTISRVSDFCSRATFFRRNDIFFLPVPIVFHTKYSVGKQYHKLYTILTTIIFLETQARPLQIKMKLHTVSYNRSHLIRIVKWPRSEGENILQCIIIWKSLRR